MAVIGADLKTNLFGDADPVGQEIKIEGRPFTVVGVAEAKGSVFGQSQDAFVDIPIGTYFQIYGSRTGIRYAARASRSEGAGAGQGRNAHADSRPAARTAGPGRHLLDSVVGRAGQRL